VDPEDIQEILDEHPDFRNYLSSINAKLYYCDRTNDMRVSGKDFDLSLELFISVQKREYCERPALTVIKGGKGG